MSSVIVLGNGESRKSLNLQKINLPIIGCNAIHRDTVVDHLITCDRRMLHEAVTSKNTANTKIYVRPDNYHHFRKMVKDKRIHKVPDLPYRGDLKQDQSINWGSGGFALILAAELNYDNILVAGFDLYGINDKVNNIYKDTINYLSSDRPAVDYSYWKYQISKVFENYPNKKFIIYNDERWELPGNWKKPNVEFKNILTFDLDNKYFPSKITEVA